jgi:cellulose synthase/poly-beta-1,6-N-acetylglucosamine synthase-like glycosyltransferase
VSGHLQAVRADLFEPIPPGTILDDQHIGLAVLNRGYRVIVEPNAICWEGSSAAMHGEVARRRRITAGRFALLTMLGRQFPNITRLQKFQLISHKVLRLFIPFYMLIAYLGNIFLVLGPDWFGQDIPPLRASLITLLIAQTVFYGAALGGAVAERLGRRSKVLYLPYFLCSTNMASLSGLLSYFSQGTQVTWQRVQREEA